MISNENIKHVAVYLRLSRDEEKRGVDEVLASHRDTLTEICKRNDWSFETFEEIASSRTIEKRKEMVELLKRIRKNHFDAVVVMDIDRLSRNEFDASDIKKELFISGTLIVTPSKIYDPAKDEDSLLLGIQALVAAQEYKQILKRMQQGKRYASKQGQWMNGLPPFGYDKNPKTKKLVPNENAKHAKFIFDAIVGGKTVSDVYHELNRMSVKTANNSKFAFNSILRIVNNEAYKGTIISNRIIGKDEAVRPRNEWIIFENAHPAIVDEATWNRANKIVNTYSFSAPRSKNKIYPTTKLIFCGNCGKVQGTQLAHTGKLYLKICPICKNRTYLYEPILRQIREQISKRGYKIVALIQEYEQNDNSAEIEYKKQQIEKAISVALRAIEKAREGYEAEVYTIDELKETKAKRESEIKQLKLELEKIQHEDPKDKLADLNKIKEQVDYLLGNWQCLDDEGLTDEEVNRALHYIVERIEWTYSKEDAEPNLHFVYKE